MDRKLNLLLKNRNPIGAAGSIEDKRLVAMALLDRAAGTARANFITVAPGQDAVYAIKAEEAQLALDMISNGDQPDPVDFPHLAAGISEETPTIEDVALQIVNKKAEWSTISAEIEQKRFAAKSAISVAEDEQALRLALNVAWPIA